MVTSRKKKVSELDDMISQDAAAPPNQKVMVSITELVTEWKKLSERAAVLQGQLDDTEKRMSDITQGSLPSMMDEAGTKLIGLVDGTSVKRDDKIIASIAAADMPGVTADLIKSGHSAIIKTGFNIPLDKGDVKTAKKIATALKKLKVEFEQKESIHPQTLNAFVREAIENGRMIPSGIYFDAKPIANIKVPKPKGGQSR